ncbi:AAA family ATPase [Methylomagnum ishizawai]|uniref:AAA family ATPase n=1 Tax=Methylomagnum ishizawai TaxID=1760988 RepID=UPI001C339487|nr:AAA family ATPase [Methylomagnum ishizawai]BBL74942.1 hypothetical protein MishRS11D_20400 [Methylomagnum ishizawai]
MYTQFFKFAEPPFSIAPNPRYLYLSPQHKEALAHLLYGIGVGGGFVALTGEVGTGKTTLCRCLLEQLPEDVDIALIFNPRLDSRELVESLCDELHIAHPAGASLKPLIDALNRHLLDAHAKGRRTIVLIDEAQNLSFEVLEQIRLLTNLETHQAKLLQIILVGQPELGQLLERRDLRQLAQRITARYHLDPLSRPETADYVRHRLAVGGTEEAIFTRAALAEIHRRSEGVPRLINVLCDRALLGAYSLGRRKVDRGIVRKSARELRAERSPPRRPWTVAAGVALSLGIGAGLAYFRPVPGPDFDAWLGAARKTVVGEAPKPSAAADPAQAPTQPPAPPSPTANAAPATPVPIPAPATQPPEPPAAVPLAQALADPAPTRAAAFARLFALWQREPPAASEDPCAYAGQHGLRCLPLHGTWFKLRSFDHPALLELVLPGGGRGYATLTAVADGRVELDWGAGVHGYALAELLPFWKGDAVLLWQPPLGGTATLVPGERTPAVRWVRERLRLAAPAGGEEEFDADLKARVVAFQTEHGLVPDGKVGTQTLIYLEALGGDPAVPRLEAVPPH